MLLGLLVAFNVGHLLTLRRCEGALLALTLESKALTSFDPASIATDLREEVADIVADVMANIRTPTMADHLGGVISQFAQVRMMKALQADGMLPVADALTDEHGSALD